MVNWSGLRAVLHVTLSTTLPHFLRSIGPIILPCSCLWPGHWQSTLIAVKQNCRRAFVGNAYCTLGIRFGKVEVTRRGPYIGGMGHNIDCRNFLVPLLFLYLAMT